MYAISDQIKSQSQHEIDQKVYTTSRKNVDIERARLNFVMRIAFHQRTKQGGTCKILIIKPVFGIQMFQYLNVFFYSYTNARLSFTLSS